MSDPLSLNKLSIECASEVPLTKTDSLSASKSRQLRRKRLKDSKVTRSNKLGIIIFSELRKNKESWAGGVQ